jgi:hypothetical protein
MGYSAYIPPSSSRSSETIVIKTRSETQQRPPVSQYNGYSSMANSHTKRSQNISSNTCQIVWKLRHLEQLIINILFNLNYRAQGAAGLIYQLLVEEFVTNVIKADNNKYLRMRCNNNIHLHYTLNFNSVEQIA